MRAAHRLGTWTLDHALSCERARAWFGRRRFEDALRNENKVYARERRRLAADGFKI